MYTNVLFFRVSLWSDYLGVTRIEEQTVHRQGYGPCRGSAIVRERGLCTFAPVLFPSCIVTTSRKESFLG